MKTPPKIISVFFFSTFILSSCFNDPENTNNNPTKEKTNPTMQNTTSLPNEDLQVRKQIVSFDKDSEKLIITDSKAHITIDPGFPEWFPKDFPIMGTKKVYKNSNVPRYLFYIEENKSVTEVMSYYTAEAKKNGWKIVQDNGIDTPSNWFMKYLLPKTNQNLVIKANSQIPLNLADMKLRWVFVEVQLEN